jgi:hypothetical protein
LCGESWSATATVADAGDPWVETQPVPLQVCAGNQATFFVEGGGVGPFSYDWRKDGQSLGAPDSPYYVIDSVALGDQGDYSCEVTNMCGFVVSNDATLTVKDGPVFTLDPVSQCAATGATVVMISQTVGGGTVFRTWEKWNDGTQQWEIIGGQFTSTLTLSNVSSADAGLYRAAATDLGTSCTAHSEVAALVIDAWGDMDFDGDVDLVDMGEFTRCFGAGSGTLPACSCANPDGSADVDLADWAAFETEVTGPQ